MWPFKRSKRAISQQSRIEKDDLWVTIDEIGFFGEFAESPDGKFTVAWADREPSGNRGGFRNSGHGSYILACEDQLVLKGNMERPNDGRVADNGSFVLNDWLFGEGLNGVFYAINRDGSVLVQRRFEANLLNNSISSDGRFALCQTCNSDTPDGNLLCLFDLGSGETLWSRNPATGWTWDYSFDIEKSILSVQHEHLSKFRYGLKSGEFLDEERWIEERTKHGSGFELLDIAKERITQLKEPPSEDEINDITELLKTALGRGLDTYPHQQAIVFRNLGELKERVGDQLAAIDYYEKAMEKDSKVGVKRRLSQLKRSVEQ